jgi:ribonuclease P protein subunit POP4
MIDNKNLVKHGLIGLNIEITNSKNPTLKGVSGKIIDETKSTITIKSQKGTKIIIKDQIKMSITIDNKKVEIDGSKLVGRLEDRLKK